MTPERPAPVVTPSEFHRRKARASPGVAWRQAAKVMANTQGDQTHHAVSLVPQPTDLLWDEEDSVIDDLHRVLTLLPDGHGAAERRGGHPDRRSRHAAYPPKAETGSFDMQAATPAERSTVAPRAHELRRRAADACRAAALEQRRSVELCHHAAVARGAPHRGGQGGFCCAWAALPASSTTCAKNYDTGWSCMDFPLKR